MWKGKRDKTKEVVCEGKFLKEIKEFFWEEADYIKSVMKELQKGRDVKDITLTEQFNIGYIEWMKNAWEEMKKYFEQQWGAVIQDFKEINPEATVVDRVQEEVKEAEAKEEIKETKWKL